MALLLGRFLAVLTLLCGAGATLGRAPLTDRQGDPLPPGALTRLGTVRMRHASPVQAVVLTPDGKTVITGAIGDSIRIWDAATGAPRGVFTGPKGGVLTLALSPDSKTLVAGNGDFSLSVWDLAGRRELHRLIGHTGLARGLFFTPDGKTLLSAGADGGSGDGHLIFWDVATGKQVVKIKVDDKWVLGSALSADGKTLLTSGENKAIHVWDVATRKEIRQFPIKERLKRLALSPDGKTVATTEWESIRLWDVATGCELRRLGMPNWGSNTVAFSPDGKTLAADDFCTIVFFDPATGERTHRLEGHRETINSLAFSADGKTLASVSHDHSVRLWDTAMGKERLEFEEPAGSAIAAYFTPDGKQVVTGHRDCWLRVWDANAGRLVRSFGSGEFAATASRLMTMALSPDGKIAASSYDGECAIYLWDVATGRERSRFIPQKHLVRSLAFTPDGRTLASAGYGRHAYLWDVATGNEVRVIDAGVGAVFSVSLSGNGSLLSLAGHDFVHRIFTVADGRMRLATAKLTIGGPLTLSPDGRFLAVVAEGNPTLWEASSGKPFLYAGGRSASWDAPARAFSADGRLLAWGDQENVVHITDTRSGQERGRFEGHGGPVTCVSFSADGKRLLSTAEDGTVLVWDATQLAPARFRPVKFTASHPIDACWTDLASDDADKARWAVERLVAFPESSVPFLRERVRPVPPEDGKRIALLIRELDSDDFETREKATAELSKLGEAIEETLREALKKTPPPEARQRLERILDTVSNWQFPLTTGEPLRNIRAVEVLERVGAKEVLEVIAQGNAGSRLTLEAKNALKRLERERNR